MLSSCGKMKSVETWSNATQLIRRLSDMDQFFRVPTIANFLCFPSARDEGGENLAVCLKCLVIASLLSHRQPGWCAHVARDHHGYGNTLSTGQAGPGPTHFCWPSTSSCMLRRPSIYPARSFWSPPNFVFFICRRRGSSVHAEREKDRSAIQVVAGTAR